MSISMRVQELREQNSLSQEQLADKLNVSRQAVSKWETEQANPDIGNIILLSEVFNVSTDYLLLGETKELITTHTKETKQSGISKVIQILLIIFASVSALGLLYYISLYISMNLL